MQTLNDAMQAAGLPSRPIPEDGKINRLSSTEHIWQVLIENSQRSPSEAKQSIMTMRTIGLLDDFICEFLIATLKIGEE